MNDLIQFLDPEPIDIIKDDSDLNDNDDSDTADDLENDESNNSELNIHITNNFNENDEIDTTVTTNTTNSTTLNHNILKKKFHSSSIRTTTVNPLNEEFNFLRVQINDCTMVKGIQGNTFAVWKITVLLQTKNTYNELVTNTIEFYRRYSEFVNFREQLVKRSQYYNFNCNIPKLPPKLPWYCILHYEADNLNKKWLIKRQKGLNAFINGVIMHKDVVEHLKDLIIQFIKQ